MNDEEIMVDHYRIVASLFKIRWVLWEILLVFFFSDLVINYVVSYKEATLKSAFKEHVGNIKLCSL